MPKPRTTNTPTIAQMSQAAAPSKKKPIIEIDKVTKSFKVGKNVYTVLKNINIKIYPQEFIIILGPSGSGKSTLLNILLGLEAPSSGRVILNNSVITGLKPDKISKIRYNVYGIVFQKADWLRSLNVQQNVALPLAINNVGRNVRLKLAMQRLKEVGMDDHALYMPTELSGGQQQKVSLARALIKDPPIVVADEPTGNLDSASADRVMQQFKNLNEEHHKTVLMVTHNIDYVRYASRTIYVRDGQVIEGSTQFAL